MGAPQLWGTQFLVNTTTYSGQDQVKVQAFKDGSFLAVWQCDQQTQDSTRGDLRGQFFYADGTKKGGEFVIAAPYKYAFHIDPCITILDENRFMVSWGEEPMGSHDYRAQIYQTNGTPLGAAFDISRSDQDTFAQSFASLSDGRFAVALVSDDTYSGKDIEVQFFDAAGHALGNAIAVNDGTEGNQVCPVIVGVKDHYMVFYQDVNELPGSALRGRVLHADGSLSAEFLVGTSVEDIFEAPAATVLHNGRVALAWTEKTSETQPYVVKVQVFDADGTKHGVELAISAGMAGASASKPQIISTADGGFALAIRENTATGIGIRVLTFNSEGVRLGDVLVDTVKATTSHSLSELADGRIIVSWDYADGTGGDEDGVHAQIVDPRDHAVALAGTNGDDHYFGTRFHDLLKGAAGKDRLNGDAGNDKLYGETGDDILFGGAGKDTLYGARGKDVFVFDTAPSKKTNVDTIKDYSVKDDSIWLENSIFKALGKSGSLTKPAKLKASMFYKGAAAHDKSDHLIYNKHTGALYYDKDGIGGAAQVKIAQLKAGLGIIHKDFFVI